MKFATSSAQSLPNQSNKILIDKDTLVELTKKAKLSYTFQVKAFYLESEVIRKSEQIDSLKSSVDALNKEIGALKLDVFKLESAAAHYKEQRNRIRWGVSLFAAGVLAFFLFSSKFAWLGRIITWIKTLLGK